MIIDIHCHFREVNKPSKSYWDNLVIKTGVAFAGSPEEVDAILGDNASRILGLQ